MKPHLILALLGVLMTTATLWDGFTVVQLDKGKLIWAWWLLVPMLSGAMLLLFAHLLYQAWGRWLLIAVATVCLLAVLNALLVGYQLGDMPSLTRRIMLFLYNISAIVLILNTKPNA